jgi:hypothetical protein
MVLCRNCTVLLDQDMAFVETVRFYVEAVWFYVETVRFIVGTVWFNVKLK